MNIENKDFSRILSVVNLPKEGARVKIKATPAECKAIARSLNLDVLKSLNASIDVVSENFGEAIRLKGNFSAKIVERCVITLDSFESECEEEINALFVFGNTTIAGESTTFDPSDEIIDSISDEGTIDLGIIIFEHFSLCVEPYPRKPGISDDAITYCCGLEEEDVKENSLDNPFRILGDLRHKM